MPASFMYPRVIPTLQGNLVIVAVATNDGVSNEQTSSIDGVTTNSMEYAHLKSSAICNVFNVHKTNTSLTNISKPDGDYVAVRKSLVFEPGQTVHTVTINLLDDDLPEDEETFKVR